MIELKILTKRFGIINPASIEEYIDNGGYDMLNKAFTMKPKEIIEEVIKSRLGGRGGAAFPMAYKLLGLSKEKGMKYIICNADEGEPGNFKDRLLMENDPHQIIEGMAITAYATGATKGFIYIRGEYSKPADIMQWTIDEARRKGIIGRKSSNLDFDIEIRCGAGAYICGEEFALIESIEGKPGRTRVKPPYPTQKGLFDRPTLLNNVETLCNINHIIDMGGDKYSKIGNKNASGTKLISLSGNVKNKGMFEVPYGTTINDIIYKLGKGIKDNRELKMIQLSGASGPIIPIELLDMEIDNEGFDGFGGKIGAGAIIVIDDRFDLFKILLKTIKFFEHESCGKCTPCREGHIQLVILLNRFLNYEATLKDLKSLESLANVMSETSLCGLGQSSPTSILSTLKYFKSEYLERLSEYHYSEVE